MCDIIPKSQTHSKSTELANANEASRIHDRREETMTRIERMFICQCLTYTPTEFIFYRLSPGGYVLGHAGRHHESHEDPSRPRGTQEEKPSVLSSAQSSNLNLAPSGNCVEISVCRVYFGDMAFAMGEWAAVERKLPL